MTLGLTDVPTSPLRRELGRLDTVLFLISALVVVDTIGAIAAGGGQAFAWLVTVRHCHPASRGSGGNSS
jgi:hypothetical protein